MRFVSGLKRSDLQHKVSIFHGGRTVDGVVGEVVVGVQHPQLLRLEHVLVPGLKHGQLLFSVLDFRIQFCPMFSTFL